MSDKDRNEEKQLSERNDKSGYTFDVKMTAKEVFRFSIHHSYFRLSGVIGILMSLMAVVILVSSFQNLGDQNKVVLLIVALWFTVLEPLTLLSRAKSQAKRNPAYKKPLTYTLNEEGITVSQEEQSQSIAWNQLMKIVETSSQYLVYSSKIHAFVFPKSAMGEQQMQIVSYMSTCAKKAGVKMSGKIRNRNIETSGDENGK